MHAPVEVDHKPFSILAGYSLANQRGLCREMATLKKPTIDMDSLTVLDYTSYWDALYK